MCSIIHLPPGTMFPEEKLKNAIYNNPHGWGIILLDSENKKIEVKKGFPKTMETDKHPKECDPKKIIKILKDNMDIDRFLHVRNKSQGEINIENTHPFSVYNSNSRQVYFMHNGTLQDYKPKTTTYTYYNNVRVDDPKEGGEDQTRSDSLNFAERFLQPLLVRVSGENGHGDIKDEFIEKLINKSWGSDYNRGLLVSNEQGPLYIGRWKKKIFKDSEGKDVEFLVSNDDYFDELKRGPEYERRKAEEKKIKEAKEEEERQARISRFREANNVTGGSGRFDPTKNNGQIIGSGTQHKKEVKPVRLIDFRKRNTIENAALQKLLRDKDLTKGLEHLANMTSLEVSRFAELAKSDDVADLILLLSSEYKRVCVRIEKAERKKFCFSNVNRTNVELKFP